MRAFAALFLATLLPNLAAAAECTARSGPTVTPLVELYTSEGCSSCPPADRWLSTLASDAAAGRLVAVAFHVDYWDSIGWKDPFATARGTGRQREIQSLAGARYVYTPQVVMGGRDFRGWSTGASGAMDAIRRKPAQVSIVLEARADASKGIEVRSRTAAANGLALADLVVLLAATQDRLASRVTAGENRGERLAHDFVVRDFILSRGLGEASAAFRPAAGWDLAHMSVAAFVQSTRTGEVLQAVSCRL